MKKTLCYLIIATFGAQLFSPLGLHAGSHEEKETPIPHSESRIPNSKLPNPQCPGTGLAEPCPTLKQWLFRDIPRDLWGSLKTSYWGWGGIAFILGTGLTAVLHPLDDDLDDSWDQGELFGHTGNQIIGWTISPYVLGAGGLFTWIIGHQTGHPKVALTGRAMSEALALSLGITAAGKLAFRREAPDGGNFSFPSGHATAAFSTAGVLTTFYGWKAGIPSYALAALVSLSRLDDKEHFLSDVVMGAVIGSVIGIGTARFHKKRNPNFFLSPMVNHQEAGLQVLYRF